MSAQTATLRSFVFPRSSILTNALLVVGGAGLVAACAQISIWRDPVPITGQTFAVLVVGASLGPVLGASSLILYMLVGLANVPVFAPESGTHHHKHGYDVVSGPTGGYIIGFIVAAILVGWLAERGWDKKFSTSVSMMLTGSVVIYAFGVPWLHHWFTTNGLSGSWSFTFQQGLYPYIPGDIVKLYLAALTLPAAWKLVRYLKRDN